MKPENLIMGTKYEDLDKIFEIKQAEEELSKRFKPFFEEMNQNFRYVQGELYSEADLKKLRLEERPAFRYNLALPIILHLVGNFKNNQSRVVCDPVTPDDFRLSRVGTDLIDYIHYVDNQLDMEMAKAYTNAIIGRVGWIVQDWDFERDTIKVESYDPYRLIYDNAFTRKDFKNTNIIMDRGWYTPEEISNIFAYNKEDMHEEIMTKAKMFLGADPNQFQKIIAPLQRLWGSAWKSALGRSKGYDAQSEYLDNMINSGKDFFDYSTGLFKVVESHERRSEWRMTFFNAKLNTKVDITDEVGFDGKNYDTHKLLEMKKEADGECIVSKERINRIYKTAVCPGLNMKLTDVPYKWQNGNFKYTPIFCFDFGNDSLEWKSYIDQIIDPIKSYTLSFNTIQTLEMRKAHGETWYEESALQEFEEDFTKKTIGGYKKVKDGTLQQGKIKQVENNAQATGSHNILMIAEELVKKIPAIRDNALGTRENSSESGRLYQARVAQTDMLQTVAQDNAIQALKQIGQNTIDMIKTYMPEQKAMRITSDSSSPYWMIWNKDVIKTLTQDEEGNMQEKDKPVENRFNETKFDIKLRKEPIGDAAKALDYERTYMTIEMLMKLNPKLIDPKIIVELSESKYKDKMLQFIEQTEEQTKVQQEQILQEQAKAIQLQNMEKEQDLQLKQLEIEDKQNDLMIDDVLKGEITEMINRNGM